MLVWKCIYVESGRMHMCFRLLEYWKYLLELLTGPEVVTELDKIEMEDSNLADIELTVNIKDTFLIPSAKGNNETLWKWLHDENIGTIAISGEPLTGKTWTARQLIDRVAAAHLFDAIIWVHEALNNYEAQNQIVDQLKLKLEGATTRESYWVATHVKEELLRKMIFNSLVEKKFLLILDHISSCDLKDLGVPHPQGKRKSSKVLMTFEPETYSQIEVDNVLKLEKLSTEEAWLLFQKVTGPSFIAEMESLDAQELVQPLVENCKGVPLDIVTLAGTFRNLGSDLPSSTSPSARSTDSQYTYNVRAQLFAKIQKVHGLVFSPSEMSRVQFVCEMIPNKVVKDCFLFCLTYPKYHQFSVKGLITLWMKCGFLDCFDCLENAYDKGLRVVRDLVERHLFVCNGTDKDVIICLQTQLVREAVDHVNEIGFQLDLLLSCTLGGGTGASRNSHPILLKNGNLDTKHPLPDDSEVEALAFMLYGNEGCLPSALPDAIFKKMPHLEDVVLLHVGIKSLPTSLSMLNHLHVLVVRGCGSLENVNQIKELHHLRILCLSGASSLKEIPDDIFQNMGGLERLDLSNNQFKQLPSSFSVLREIRFLTLGGCSNLEKLPSMEYFVSLCLLDLSGASALSKLPEISSSLRMLNISETRVDRLPSASILKDLEYLVIRGCSSIKSVPHPRAFPQLKVLDLSGSHDFVGFEDENPGTESGDESLSCLLQIDLSGTKCVEVPFLSSFVKVQEVSLRGCSSLERLPLDIGDMLNLRKLDLSESAINSLPLSTSKLRNLRELLLKGCSQLATVPPLEDLTELKVLDMSYTSRGFLSGCSKLTGLRFLGVGNRKYIWGYNWENKEEVTEKLNVCESEEIGKGCIYVTVNNTSIFFYLETNPKLWEKCLQRFHFCLCSIEEWGKETDIYLQEKRLDFKNIHYHSVHIPLLKDEPDKFFKICGFKAFPQGIELVLPQVELLFLKKNDFLTRLSDVGAEYVNIVRECWIERCNKMEGIFYGDDISETLALGRCLENLCISNLAQLKCLFKGLMPTGSFTLLKHMYVECCPRLVIIFSSSLELSQLETLKIKFCEELEHIFEDQQVLGEQSFPRLKRLVLWNLPKLQSICGGVLPSLTDLRVKGCSKLEKLPISVSSTSQVEIRGEKVWWDKMLPQLEGILSHLLFTDSYS
ncbi:hypothetical protein ACHQM5_025639 [Ranunculus cassubicifolius]